MKPSELFYLLLVAVVVTVVTFFRCKAIFGSEWTCPKCGYSQSGEAAKCDM